jgi:hypothetical protein
VKITFVIVILLCRRVLEAWPDEGDGAQGRVSVPGFREVDPQGSQNHRILIIQSDS